MKIAINGKINDFEENLNLAALVSVRFSEEKDAIAIAVNGEVVPKSTWETFLLSDGDKVEVLTVSQGG